MKLPDVGKKVELKRKEKKEEVMSQTRQKQMKTKGSRELYYHSTLKLSSILYQTVQWDPLLAFDWDIF